MANEIFLDDRPAGLTIKHYIWSGGQIYNGSGFVAPVAANWATYARAYTEILIAGAPSRYVADFPAAITTAGVYVIESKIQGGGAPDPNDAPAGQTVGLAWDGAREIVGTISAGRSGGGNQIA